MAVGCAGGVCAPFPIEHQHTSTWFQIYPEFMTHAEKLLIIETKGDADVQIQIYQN